jgi:FKBP-type peptidyl-prolyl cis-trans isomerase FkpA
MKRSNLAFLVAVVLLGAACNKQAPATGAAASPSPAGMSEQDKAVYAAGFMLGQRLAALNPTPSELEAAKKGLADAVSGKKAEHALETYGPRVQALLQERQTAKAQGEKEKGKAFQDQAAAEQGAQRTGSGLVMKTLTPGQGASPKASDVVKVHYKGTLTDGTEFDSSYKRGEPVQFPLSGVIPCWTEGVQKMKVGEKARLVCPSDIGYGDAGSPPNIPGGATLVFEVELLGIGTGK